MKHGHFSGGKKSPTYKSWATMIERCSNKNSDGYASYGGAGIAVCERWRSFKNFLADMGERPAGKTIDRIDNAKGYEPSNCRWATAAEQQQNTRQSMRWHISGTVYPSVQAAADVFGVSDQTIRRWCLVLNRDGKLGGRRKEGCWAEKAGG